MSGTKLALKFDPNSILKSGKKPKTLLSFQLTQIYDQNNVNRLDSTTETERIF